MLPNVRRLAALDMYGTSGSARRRRLIRAEFIIGVAGCTLLSGSGWTIALGIWPVATGMNYVPLAISAQALSRPAGWRRSWSAPTCRASCDKLAYANSGSSFRSPWLWPRWRTLGAVGARAWGIARL
jgi:hypothetical protein